MKSYEKVEREFIEKAEELTERFNINFEDLIDILKDFGLAEEEGYCNNPSCLIKNCNKNH